MVLLNLVPAATLAHEGHNEAFSGSSVETKVERVTVKPEGQKSIGLQTKKVHPGSIDLVITATGRVEAAENRSYDVNPSVNGIVTQVYVKQGDAVRANQVLATIHSVDVASAISTVLTERAKIQADAAKTRTQHQQDIAVQQKEVEITKISYDRATQLLSEGITARKDYLDAKNAYEVAKVKLASVKKQMQQDYALAQKQLKITTNAARDQARVMGVSVADFNRAMASNAVVSDIPIPSPFGGIITFRDITPGENVGPGKKLFSIVNLSPIWIVVDVFQEQLPRISIGQEVSIKTSANQKLHGKISSIGTIIDSEKRTLPIRVVSDNHGGILKPGMFVTAEIIFGQGGGSRMTVPSTALVDDNGHSFVFVKYGNAFQPAFVKIGQRTSEQVEIADGLYDGDEVVTRGAQQLHAQSILNTKTKSTSTKETHEPAPTNSAMSVLPGFLIGIFTSALIALLAWFFLRKRSP